MIRYSIEPRTGKYVKGCGFLSLGRKLSNKFIKQLLDAASKTELNALKITTKTVAHKAPEATREFIENKIAEKIAKPKLVPELTK